jgi:predicted MPP superfamily phosphohydrolase
LTPIEGVSALKILTGKLKATTQVFTTSDNHVIRETTIKTEKHETIYKMTEDTKRKAVPDDEGRIGYC